ncbi:acyltransferase [Burkholderia sp. CCA53]|uniref:acyltransferase family protein n=1 Tax=Burkholderia sp. CCA53 TaxID=1776288 RepID=UPI0009F66DEB|nr:acyltransferase [Burkholderia sp. CCA53]
MREQITDRQISEVTRGPGKALPLEGLRGVAALAVVFSHCFYTFFPFLQTGEATDLHYAWEYWLLNSPLRFFYNGTFAVTVFFVMSGYVLTRKFFESGDLGSLQDGASKRYLRLGIPVAASVMLCYGIMSLGVFPSNFADLGPFIRSFYQFDPSINTALRDAIYGSLVFGQSRYNYVLWTIGVEFLGSLMLFAYLALFGRSRFRSWVAVAISILLMIASPTNGILYALFFVGAFMHTWRAPESPWSVATCVMIGLYLGGYHWYSVPYQPIVAVAEWIASTGVHIEWPIAIPAIGSVLLVYAVLGKNTISELLSTRPAVWLGDKSFSLYLTHTFVLSSLGIYVYLWTSGQSHQLRAWAATASVAVASMAFSSIFARFVDAPSVRLAQRFGKVFRAATRADRTNAPSRMEAHK